MLFSPEFNDALGLMLFLLNPFLLVIYLVDLINDLDSKTFSKILIRASLISAGAYLAFAALGDSVFELVFQSNFASFQIFGGLVFLITGLRFVFEGNTALKKLRGEATHIEGSIVMPIMVGPGTISGSIIVGQSLPLIWASFVIVISLIFCVGIVILLKKVYNHAHERNEKLVLKYIDITGRISALLIGTFSVEMIMTGFLEWSKQF